MNFRCVVLPEMIDSVPRGAESDTSGHAGFL